MFVESWNIADLLPNYLGFFFSICSKLKYFFKKKNQNQKKKKKVVGKGFSPHSRLQSTISGRLKLHKLETASHVHSQRKRKDEYMLTSAQFAFSTLIQCRVHTQEMAAAHMVRSFYLKWCITQSLTTCLGAYLIQIAPPSNSSQVALDCAKLTELSITIPLIANHWPPLCLNIL